jgi:hypothetical protein
MDAYAPQSLLAYVARVPDPQSRHGQRHPFVALLALACAALLCGARSFTARADWARHQDLSLLHRLGIRRSPPTDGAYEYLFCRLDSAALEDALRDGIAAVLPAT